MQECKGMKTPMPTSGHLDLTKEDKPVDQKVYRSMIGSLLYLCASRPDIMLSVCMCATISSGTKRVSSLGREKNCEILDTNTKLWHLVSQRIFL